MLLKSNANEEDLRNAASLEAWSTEQALEKGRLTPSQRAYFMHQLSLAADSIAAKIIEDNPDKIELKTKPKRTRKPPAGAPKPVVRKRKRPDAPA